MTTTSLILLLLVIISTAAQKETDVVEFEMILSTANDTNHALSDEMQKTIIAALSHQLNVNQSAITIDIHQIAHTDEIDNVGDLRIVATNTRYRTHVDSTTSNSSSTSGITTTTGECTISSGVIPSDVLQKLLDGSCRRNADGFIACDRTTFISETYETLLSREECLPEIEMDGHSVPVNSLRPVFMRISVSIHSSKERSALHIYDDLRTALEEDSKWLQGTAEELRPAFRLTVSEPPKLRTAAVDENAVEWRTTDWSKCSIPCGGGHQQRQVNCYVVASERLVGEWMCNAMKRPIRQRQCNTHSCSLRPLDFRMYTSIHSQCRNDCSEEFVEKAQHCIESTSGYISSTDRCTIEENNRLHYDHCYARQCSKSHWKAGAWSVCNRECSGGLSFRNISCVDKTETTIAEDNCSLLPKPELKRPCNTAPCERYAWNVGPWNTCDRACDTGRMKREVQCIASTGETVKERNCLGEKPIHQKLCNRHPCDFCKNNHCSNHGVCKNGGCKCFQKFHGIHCQLKKDCSGVLDHRRKCCYSGLIDSNGTCCNSLERDLSSDGHCCREVNALGECSTELRFLAIDHQVCDGPLDAAGFCCASGRLDDCGVCSGDSTTCLKTFTAIFQVWQLNAYRRLWIMTSQLTEGLTFDAIEKSATAFLASRMHVPESFVSISSLTTQDGRRISDETPKGRVHFGVEVLYDRNNATSDTASLFPGSIQFYLHQAQNTVVDDIGVFLGVDKLTSKAICGNGVCEINERPRFVTIRQKPVQNEQGCAADCPFAYHECPTGFVTLGVQPKPCSGRGVCHTTTGQCSCWPGYVGHDCSQCDKNGYIRSEQHCVLLLDLEDPDAPSSQAASFIISPGIAVTIGFLALMPFVACVLLVNCRRGRTLRSVGSDNHCDVGDS